MLPIQERNKELENLLESLFQENNGEVIIFGGRINPFGAKKGCCSYNYLSYDG